MHRLWKTQEARSVGELERLKRLYAVLSQVNQAIVRARSKDDLFQSICQVAVKFGHFRLVWIGARDADSGDLTLRAKESDDQGFPHEIQASECGVVQSAIREGRPRIYNALTGSESTATCHAHALQSNIASCAAIPIFSHGRACAAFCLHARDAGFFSEGEVQLLEQVTSDISFALDKLEEETLLRQAEEEAKKGAEALQQNQRFIERILEITPNLIYVYDLIERRIVYVNRSVTDFLGYTPEEVRGMGPALLRDILHPDDAARSVEHRARIAAAGDKDTLEIEYRVRHADGHWRWLRSREVLFLKDERGVARRILGWAEDVTERKWNEAGREAMVALLHLLNAPNKHRQFHSVTAFLQQWSGWRRWRCWPGRRRRLPVLRDSRLPGPVRPGRKRPDGVHLRRHLARAYRSEKARLHFRW